MNSDKENIRNSKPISLYPLKAEDAIRGALMPPHRPPKRSGRAGKLKRLAKKTFHEESATHESWYVK
jgi:hypothetical protein